MQRCKILIVTLLISGVACGSEDASERSPGERDGIDLGDIRRQNEPTNFSPAEGSVGSPASGGNLPPISPMPPMAQPTASPMAEPTPSPVAQPTPPPATQAPSTPPQPVSPCAGKSAGQSCGSSSCEGDTHRVDQVCDGAGQCVQAKIKCEDWCRLGACNKEKDHDKENDNKDNKDKADKANKDDD